MLGVLVKGSLDDGRGKARVNLFRHKHEIESGRTSSVGMEIMGFDSRGEVVASTVPGRKLSWEEIGNRSVRSHLASSIPVCSAEFYHGRQKS
jgi:GTPase